MLHSPVLHWIAVALIAALAVGAATHALLFRRDPKAAMGWIVVCIWMPLLGPLMYFAFGINRVQRRAERLFGRRSQMRLFPGPAELAPPEGTIAPCAEVPPDVARLRHAGRALSGQPALDGNTVVPLFDGEQAFPAMLAAIEEAKHTVRLQTYIFEADPVGDQFVAALAAAHERGVDVAVMLDGVGSRYGRRVRPDLVDRGVPVVEFLPVRLLPPSPLLNLRNHRKVLSVDGEIAFTGGINLSARHLVDAPDTRFPTRDTHFAIRGPVVSQLESAFAEDWFFASGSPASAPPTAPAPASGDSVCRVILDGPDDDLDKMLLLLLAAVAEAEHRIAIVTPYFLPPRELLTALGAAALRGVRVEIVIPGRSNLRYVDWATRNMLWEPLQRGVQVRESPLPFDHTKLFVVDDKWTLIGSLNLDLRSLRLNFELGVEVYDEAFGAQMIAWFDERLERSTPITLHDVDSRSLPRRFRDALAWLAWPYL